MLVAMAAMTFTACEDVPEPYGKPQNSGNGNSGEAGLLPYSSVNMSTGWSLVSVTEGQPWTTGKSYVQATGYQKWDGADQKSNRAVEGWLVSPTINTTGADSVKISFDYTIKYTNNVSGWEDYHKIYVSNDYDGRNFETATWIPVPFTPVASPYSDWTLYSSGEIQLPQEMAGKESVFVAFWFKAPENASTTWELQNFKIESGQANSGDNPNPGGDEAVLPYESANLNTGWALVGVTADQPWSQGSSYVQATGYQKWDGADAKSNRAVEGWLVSPAINTTDADSVKISFDYTLKYTNNVSGWEAYHKIYASNNYDGTNFENATWIPVPFTPEASKFTDWTLYPSGEIQLPQELAGKENVHVAFWFKAPENASTTWELKNFKMEAGVANSGENTNPSGEVQKVTIAQFNAAAVSNDVWYELKGKVTNLKAGDKYGNFDLVDETGSVYVYGLLSEKGGEKQKFQELVAAKGITEGSVITIIGNRGYYAANDKIEVLNAYFVSIEAGNPDPNPGGEVQKVTIAQFNAAAVSNDVWYELKGKVTNLKAGDKYGNFDLVDETGSVYVYGLLSEKGGEKQKFQELVAAKGITEGSVITIIGNRGYYAANDKIEVVNAYFVSIEAGDDNPEPQTGGDEMTSVTVAQFNAAAVSNDVWYQLKGKVTNLKAGDKYGNFDLVDETGSVYVYGLLSEKGGEKQKFQELVAAKGITEGSVITIIGNRGYYAANDKIEVVNAYFVSIEPDSNNQGGGDDGQPVTAEGSYSKPYSVSAVIAKGTTAPTNNVYVKAYIVGYVDGKTLADGARFSNEGVTSNTNLLIADASNETDVSKCVPVQLPNNPVRTGLNLKDNPSFLGKQVLLYGNLEKYFSVAGVKSVTYAECDGKFFGTKP